MSANKPANLTLDELKKRRQWILWRLEDNGRPKPDKVPYSPITGCKTGCDEPRRTEWTTFDEAAQVLAQGDYSGIALVLTDGVCGIDIDGRREDDTEVQAVIRQFSSYTELSPSGEGLHILFMLAPEKLPEGFTEDYSKRYYKKNSSNNIECYLPNISKARYFTFTGNPIHDTTIKDCTEVLPAFLDAYMQRPTKAAKKALATPALPASVLSDSEVIQKASTAKNGNNFKRLYDGDYSDYGSQSEADMALCSHLAFWCGGDLDQIDRLFRQSGLMRDKWNRDDYRSSTIQTAISSTTELYNPSHGITARRGSPIARNISSTLMAQTLGGEDDYTDVALSDLFSSMYSKRARYSNALGWLYWNGQVWQPDKLQVQEMMKELTGLIFNDAEQVLWQATVRKYEAEISGDSEAKGSASTAITAANDYMKFAKRMRTTKSVKGVLELATSSLAIKIEDCDSDPFLLNTPAGMVDLRDGSVRPHDPLAYCTKITKYAPAEAAEDERWDGLLNLITQGDAELINYLQVVAGAAAIGHVYVEKIIIAVGFGANGKSTFFNALARVLGDYAGSIAADTLISSGTSKRFDLAGLLGKRLILASETEEHQHLSNSMLKQIASTDPIRAEKKHKDEFVFLPSHLTILSTNFLPKVSSNDYGTWRRIDPVPFDATITSPQTDFLEKLLERSGGAILRWIIEGAQKFIQNGKKLPECKAVTRKREQYATDNDWLTQFLEECCTVGNGHRVKSGALYTAYREWAMLTIGRAQSNKDFNTALASKGYQSHRDSSGTYWLGLTLNTGV